MELAPRDFAVPYDGNPMELPSRWLPLKNFNLTNPDSWTVILGQMDRDRERLETFGFMVLKMVFKWQWS